MKNFYTPLHYLFLSGAIIIGANKVFSQKQFWGTTSIGQNAAIQAGAIFKTDSNGLNPVVKYRFFQDENSPQYGKMIQASNGKLYGMTQLGGKNNKGAIFELDPIANTYLKIFDFSLGTGGEPYGSLVQASNGKLYGTTTTGGANSTGTIFEFDIATNVYTKKYDFSGSEGPSHRGLIQVTADEYYGLTSTGIIFEFNVSAGTYTVKYSIVSASSTGGLLKASNGKIYGVTTSDGINGMGTIFEYDTAGIFIKLFDFDGANSGKPDIAGSLIQLPTGKLYGMTYSGGVNNCGVLFEYNISTSTFTKKIDFDLSNNGAYPQGSLMLASNSKIYGMTNSGGAGGMGILFEYNATNNTLTKKLDFSVNNSPANPHGGLMQAGNGKIYGMATGFYETSSISFPGCLFEYTIASNTLINLHTLGKWSNGGDGTYGGGPYGSLIRATNGMFYGTTYLGGSNRRGVLFEYNPNNDTLTVKVNFEASNLGECPLGLLQASSGKLYGMTNGSQFGGSTSSLFEYDIVTGIATKRFDFSGGTNGSSPQGNYLMEASDGKIYGLTTGGGANGAGVIFNYNPTDSSYTKLYDFPGGAGGAQPYGSLVQAGNGKLYGTTYGGGIISGPYSSGVLFEFNLTDSTCTVVPNNFDITDAGTGVNPACGLTLASNGNLYGTTTAGGLNNNGILFELNPNTNVTTKKFDFSNASSGSDSRSALIQAGNGKLYGSTNTGGANNKGVFYEYNISTYTYTKKFDFDNTVGSNPQFSNVIEIACTLPLSTITASSDTVCAGSSGVLYEVSSEPGSTYTFDYQGFDVMINSNGGSSATLDFLNSATNGLLEITASNYCGTSIVASINVVVTPFVVSAGKTNVSCNGGNDGSANVSVSGGVQPYTYQWSNGASTDTLSGLAAGTYSVTAISTNGCSGSVTVTVIEPPAITIATTITDANCSGCGNGSAAASVTGGVSPYSYLWSDNQTSSSATGLAAGIYSLTVTDSEGCTGTGSITVSEPLCNLLATISSTTNASCSGNDGSATVTVTGLDKPIVWTKFYPATLLGYGNNGGLQSSTPQSNGWNNGAYATQIPAGADFTLKYKIRAGNGYNQIMAGYSNVSPVAGTFPSHYMYLDASSLSGMGQSGTLADGQLTVLEIKRVSGIITASRDGNLPTTVEPNNAAIYPHLIIWSDSSLVKLEEATITTGGFSYLWSNGQTSITATGLGGGSYTVTFTNSDSCTATANVIITQPAVISLTISGTNTSCIGCSDGTATATVTGGTSPYSYQWSNGSTTSSITNLQSSIYNLTVTDSSGCTATSTVTISQPTCNLSIASTSQTNVTCNGGNNGSASVIVTGGSPPYAYSWSNGASTGSAPALSAGTYSVIVSDTSGCSDTAAFTITQPSAISVIVTSTNPSCNTNTGSATASVTGGKPPYSYQWNSGDLSNTADSLTSGLYFVTVTDTSGCVKTALTTLSDAGAPVITVSSTADVSCSGANNGSINISVSGGMSPYAYLWSNGATTEDISGLYAGPYEVEVSGNNGCKSTKSINVDEPAPLTVFFTVTDASCGNNTGSIMANPSGGTAPYSFAWSNSGNAATINNLAAGIYQVTITDNKNCVLNAQSSVSETGAASITIDSVLSANCNGAGGIYITASGGSTPYTYQWTNNANTEDLTGVSSGSYGLFVTSGSGCISTIVSSIPFVTPVADPICLVTVDTITGTNKVVWEKTAGQSIASYKIYRETSQSGIYQLVSSVLFDSLSAFTDPVANPLIRSWRYKISAVDSCGNESVKSDEHKTIHLTVNLGLNNSINLIWDHYQGFNFSTYYIYRYKPQTGWIALDSMPNNLTSYTDFTPPTLYGLQYFIEARPQDDCSATKVENHNSSRSNRYNLAPPPADLTATSTVIDASQGNCDGEVSIIPTGGISPYSFIWDDNNNQTTATANGLCQGTYNCTVTDSEGDTAIVTVVVGVQIGIGENGVGSFRIYPNPNKGIFAIQCPDLDHSKIIVYNMLGEMIWQTAGSDHQKSVTQVDISKYGSGIYHVQRVTENGNSVPVKIVVH